MQKFERDEDQQVETAEAYVAEPAQSTGARGVNLSVLLEAKRRTAEEYGLPDGIRASASLLELAERPLGIAGRGMINSVLPVDSLRLAAGMRQSWEQIALDLAPMRVDSLLSMRSIAEEVMDGYRRQWQEFQDTMAMYRQAVGEQQRQMLASLTISAQAAMMPWPTLYPEAPRRQVYTPEPEPTAEEQTLEVVHLQGDWRAALTTMIHDRRVSPAELIQLALAHSERARPGQKLPPWEEIEAICLDYERNRRRYPNQEVFAHRHGISPATLKRYRKLWKAGRSM